MQSALGLSQFSTLNKRIELKRKIHGLFKKVKSEFFEIGNFLDHEVPWFIDLTSKTKKDLNDLKELLSKNKIETRTSYPALSKQKYLKDISNQDLSYSEKMHEKILWLPSSVDLDEKSITKIVKIINKFGS